MAMDIDGASTTVEDEEDVPTCTCSFWTVRDVPPSSHRHLDRSPPSLLPPCHYCDITGRDVRVARAMSFCDLLSMNKSRTRICARGSGTTTRTCTISSRTSCAFSPLACLDPDDAPLLSPGVAKDYLSARVASPIVK